VENRVLDKGKNVKTSRGGVVGGGHKTLSTTQRFHNGQNFSVGNVKGAAIGNGGKLYNSAKLRLINNLVNGGKE
jgi:hypothetical protein